MYHGTTSKNVRVHLIVAAHPAMYFSAFLAPPLLPILVKLEILHCTNHLLSDLFSENCEIHDLSEKNWCGLKTLGDISGLEQQNQ
jgi:hypothetical protein